jgi:SH3-like domain-containing protein
MTLSPHHLTPGQLTTARLVKKLATLGLVLSCLAASAWVDAREFVSVNKPHINMRSGAGTQHSALWSLSKGYPLEVRGRQGNWLKVRDFENDVGWVYRPLVGHKPHVIVKSTVANIRLSPNTRSRIMGKAQHGEILRHLGRKSGWVKVQRDDGRQGWMVRRLVWGW